MVFIESLQLIQAESNLQTSRIILGFCILGHPGLVMQRGESIRGFARERGFYANCSRSSAYRSNECYRDVTLASKPERRRLLDAAAPEVIRYRNRPCPFIESQVNI